MDLETIQILLDLLNPLHGSVDRQIMEQVTDESELDAPSDREYDVSVTVRMERDLTQAVCILEDRKRQAALSPPQATEGLCAALKPFAAAADWYDAETIRDSLTKAERPFEDQHAIACGDGLLITVGDLRKARAALSLQDRVLTAEQVEWVVNDIAELGVKIGNQFFWLYKGRSLVYGDDEESRKAGVALWSDGDEPLKPHKWRPVFKREFGECAHPINYADPTKIGTVSLDDSDDWKPLPAPPAMLAEDRTEAKS